MLKDVSGKTAFITGGASGMGLGMAKVFAKHGMNVVIADIRQSALDEAVSGFSDTNFPVHAVKLDVADRDEWVKAADEAEEVYGNIHLLALNAGVGIAGKPMQNCTYKDWDFNLSVNVGGVVNGLVTVLPRTFQQPLTPLFSTDSLGYLGGFLSTFQFKSGVNYTMTQANNAA